MKRIWTVMDGSPIYALVEDGTLWRSIDLGPWEKVNLEPEEPTNMSKALWYDTIDPFLGYFDTFQVAEGLGSDPAIAGIYYDAILGRFKMSDYQVSATPYNGYIEHCYTTYIEEYADPSGYNLPGYWVFGEGLTEMYLRNADNDALAAFNNIMDNSAYMTTVNGQTGLNDQGRTPNDRHEISREFGYCSLGYIQLKRCQVLTEAQEIRRDYCFNSSFTIIEDWCGNVGAPPEEQQATYFRPFMGSITAHMMINYYETEASEAEKVLIIAALIKLAEYCWDNCWNEEGAAFLYTDRIGGIEDDWAADEDGDPSPDLSMLIAPWYAWLWSITGDELWQLRAEAIFEGAIPVYVDGFLQSGAYLGTEINPNGKHINQQLVWGTKHFDYVEVVPDSGEEVVVSGGGGGGGSGSSSSVTRQRKKKK